VSKTLSRISPAVPQQAKKMPMTLSTFCVTLVFLIRRPVWRKYRSEAKPKSRKTQVTALPAMNSGFNSKAPTSEM